MNLTTLEQFREQCAKPPTEDEIYQAAQEAGLWPNTVHAWLPAFHRYHAIMSKRIAALPLPVMPSQDAEVMPEQAEPVAYQSRFKPDRNAGYWRSWQPCSKRSHDNHKNQPKNGDCFYETRALFDQDPSALLARIAALEAENQKLKEGHEFDKHVILQMASDLGAISHHLGIPDTEGGADPILEKIEEMEAELEKYSR